MPGRASPTGLAVSVLALLLLVAPAVARTSGPEPLVDLSAKHWVFFTDKALSRGGERAAIEAFREALPERALWRREKAGKEVGVRDLPVASVYVEAVRQAGAEIVSRSRWLNAVSVRADHAALTAIEALPFVREVRPVGVARREIPEVRPAPRVGEAPPDGRALDYGISYYQLNRIQIPALHNESFDGSGVIIAMLDTGFDTDHEAYRRLEILAERDFINDDGETANEMEDPVGQDSHGTMTLSCVGAALDGTIYGGSYEAAFVLCKTEMVGLEIEAEEDYWVEAVEWADSLGADIVSSSLGYIDWYTYEDMDGNTAVTTIAADAAAARGIVVVNSMGNEGSSAWKYMIAPADGDSVISVGALDIGGARVSWSSVGPTADGRIKPDVMVQGVDVYVVTSTDTSSYAYSDGTSFSCPLAAGAVGLLLQGHPQWTPVDVADALHSTATQSSSPDTLMGWGKVQAHDAMYVEPTGVDDATSEDLIGGRLVWARPNPARGETSLEYVVSSPARVRVVIYDVRGRLVRELRDGRRVPGTYSERWDGRDASGEAVASGVYLARVSVGDERAGVKIALLR